MPSRNWVENHSVTQNFFNLRCGIQREWFLKFDLLWNFDTFGKSLQPLNQVPRWSWLIPKNSSKTSWAVPLNSVTSADSKLRAFLRYVTRCQVTEAWPLLCQYLFSRRSYWGPILKRKNHRNPPNGSEVIIVIVFMPMDSYWETSIECERGAERKIPFAKIRGSITADRVR